jgi:fructokinase
MLWGIDLGGTKIEGVILDPENGAVLFRERVATDSELGYRHILGRIQLLVGQMAQITPAPRALGIGTPGVTDPATGRLINSNTVCLNGQPLQADLETLLGMEIRMANDANCFALAEATFGAGKGFPSVFGVIMGTGVGGGLVIDGNVVSGLHGIAGEWGHNGLDPAGERCYCGKVGCVETVISGPALERFYAQRSGFSKPLIDIAAQASHDPHAQATIQRLIESFGRAIAALINIVDPHVIILGGGVGNVPQLVANAKDAARPHVFVNDFKTQFLQPHLGDSAGVFGAALLAK